MFRYRSIQRKVSKFDPSYDTNQSLVFAVVVNGFSKSSQKEFFWKTVFFIVFVLITGLALRFSITIISGIIGGIIGGTLVANHPQILCALNDNSVTVYFYNRFSTKIIDKKVFTVESLNVIEMITKKNSYHINLILNDQSYSIFISDKTLGFKEQAKNVKDLLFPFQNYEQ